MEERQKEKLGIENKEVRERGTMENTRNEERRNYVRWRLSRWVTVGITVRDVTPCSMVGISQRYGEARRLHLHADCNIMSAVITESDVIKYKPTKCIFPILIL